MAVRLVVLFFKCAFIQLFQAEGANKMFRVEFSMHGRNTSTSDWFLTIITERATF